MVIAFSVLLKIALVGTGGDDRAVFAGDSLELLVGFGEWLADTDAERGAVWLCAYCENIAAEVDQGAVAAFGNEVIAETVCDVALCDAAEINGCLWIEQV